MDSEIVAGNLAARGYDIVNDPWEAEVILLNTCSFLKAATQEAIDTTLEFAQYKLEGKCKWLIVCGCLPQRYGNDLALQLPEVDAFIGTGELGRIGDVLAGLENKELPLHRQIVAVGPPQIQYTKDLPRFSIPSQTDTHYRYLKISEGCDHTCSFCTIPSIRGKYKSRTLEDIIDEAKLLADSGAREIIVIAQDSTSYGLDLYGKRMLYELLSRLSRLEKVSWIRLFYAYPNNITDELLEVIAKEPKICKYIDLPLQHCSAKILKVMKRGGSRESLKRLIKRVREKIPGVVIRTTFIVGFPGETEEEFQELAGFVKEMQFERMGTFIYSKEDTTIAAQIYPQVHWQTKRRRMNSLMKLQSEISTKRNKETIGNILQVIIDEEIDIIPDYLNENIHMVDNKIFVGRTEGDAPDIDQNVYVMVSKNNSYLNLKPGDMLSIKVTDAVCYDLIGVPWEYERGNKLFLSKDK